MRELKFRHYNLFTNEMHYSEKDFHCLEHYFSNREYDSSDEMQFTGLKDKNGIEIYEGDILKGLVGYFSVSISGYFSSGSVGFGVNYSRCGDCSEFSIEGNPFRQERDFEIIGNVYENPELLESK